jgi:hypothetical protein
MQDRNHARRLEGRSLTGHVITLVICPHTADDVRHLPAHLPLATLRPRWPDASTAPYSPCGSSLRTSSRSNCPRSCMTSSPAPPCAVGLSLRHLAEGGRRFSALSIAAPAIFGATATELTLKAPPRIGPVSAHPPSQPTHAREITGAWRTHKDARRLGGPRQAEHATGSTSAPTARPASTWHPPRHRRRKLAGQPRTPKRRKFRQAPGPGGTVLYWSMRC